MKTRGGAFGWALGDDNHSLERICCAFFTRSVFGGIRLSCKTMSGRRFRLLSFASSLRLILDGKWVSLLLASRACVPICCCV